MRFSEAMRALEEGKKVRREDWNEGCFVYVLNDCLFDEKGYSRSIYLSATFLENWELYEEPVKTYSFMEAVQFMKYDGRVKREIMNWIKPNKHDAFNLKNIAHIWIHKSVNGYFLMGEMMHNKEEIVLSASVESIEDAEILLNKILED